MARQKLIAVFVLVALLLCVALPSVMAQEGAPVSPTEAGWTTHQLSFYALVSPIDWKVEASKDGQYAAIYPADGDLSNGDRIEIAYLGYEIPDGQSLQTWYDMYYRAAHGNTPQDIKVLDYQAAYRDQGNVARQRLHTTVVNELGRSQAVMLTDGRLVLSIGAGSDTDNITEVLMKIAGSIVFAPAAPKTFNELQNTTQPQPALEAILAENMRGGVITQDIVTRDAEASKNLPSLPPAVPSPEFLESERLYQKLLEQHGLPALGSSRARPGKAGGLARMLAGVVTEDRKALPPNWWSPIPTSGALNVGCSSSFHTGRAAQAIDVGLAEGTQVFAARRVRSCLLAGITPDMDI
jgi:hypothetical protein